MSQIVRMQFSYYTHSIGYNREVDAFKEERF